MFMLCASARSFLGLAIVPARGEVRKTGRRWPVRERAGVPNLMVAIRCVATALLEVIFQYQQQQRQQLRALAAKKWAWP
jgi:hypothetical protein